MNFNQFSLNTFIPQTPKLLNDNFAALKRYLDVFYNETSGIIIKPVQTTGQVSGAAGKFVTLTVDNLVVKSQFTNLFDNITTADFSWYTAFIGPDTSLRDPSIWDIGGGGIYGYIDVNKPYYKITNINPTYNGNIALRTETVSQIVELIFDPENDSNIFSILLDPCGNVYNIPAGDASSQWISFISVGYDASLGTTWVPYHFGRDSSTAGGGGGGSYSLPIATGVILGGVRVPASSDIAIDGLGNLTLEKTYIDASVQALRLYTDGSLVTLKTADNALRLYTDSSLVALKNYTATYADSSLVALKTYTDASLVALKTYVATYTDASLVALKTYTDSSLVTLKTYTDASLVALKTYTDGSLVTLKAANDALRLYTDGSLVALKAADNALRLYTDGSLVALKAANDTSLNNLGIKVGNIDVSLNNLGIKNGQQDVSLNALGIKDGNVDVSLNALGIKNGQQDVSLNAIWTQLNFDDVSLNNLSLKNTYIDISLNNLVIKDNYQDVSLNSIWSQLNFNDTSLNDLYIYDDARWIDINRCGFMNQTDTSLVFNDTTRVFTLQGGNWQYMRGGIEYSITGDTSVLIPDASGTVNYLFIDNNTGTLEQSTSVWSLLDAKLPVATLRWNPTTTPKYLLGEERHSVLIDRRMHYYLHSTSGARYLNGGVLNGPTVLGSITNSSDNCFGVSDTQIADEDIIHTCYAIPRPGNVDVSTYKVSYRSGTSTYTWKVSPVPYLYSATFIQYDNNGVLTTGSAGNFYNTYILFTNEQSIGRFTIVPGRAQFGTLNTAIAENPLDFDWTGFPIAEAVIGYQLTWSSANGNNTFGKVRLATAPRRINVGIASNPASGGSISHDSLAGLQGGATNEYYHLTSAQYSDIVGKTYVDASLVAIITKNTNQDTSLNLLFYQNNKQDSSISNQELELKQSLSTGLLHGGTLHINPTNASTFDVSAGHGYIINSYTNDDAPIQYDVSWNDIIGTIPTYLATAAATYITINASSQVNMLASPPDATQRRDNIFLGAVVHSNNTIINVVNNLPMLRLDLGAQFADLMYSLGFFSIAGNQVLANGANLKINKTAGTAFKPGSNFNVVKSNPHILTLPAQTASVFRYRNQNSLEDSDVSTLDPTTYDASGTTTTVPANGNATIQRAYIFSSGLIRMQRGQQVFSNFSEAAAAAGTEIFVTEQNISENGLYLASIIMTKASTSLQDTTNTKIIPARGISTIGTASTFATLQQSYDLSSPPHITGSFVIDGSIIAQDFYDSSGNIRNHIYRTPDSSGIGTAGQIVYDASYLYVCTSANTWGRLLLELGY